jgi:hypothetical protein
MDKHSMIALVNRSPELVDRHDRAGWLDLFSTNAVVEDPVGGGPNRKGKDIRKGKDALSRFYDIFIGPNRIKLDVHQDIIAGDEIVREVSIHTTLPNGAITIVHSYLTYRIVEENGQLKIESLRAHWSLAKSAVGMIKNSGFKGIVGSTVQFGSMIKVQGMKRIMEYFAVMYKGILKKGIKSANAFTAAVAAKDERAFARLFETGATIHFPVGGNPISAGDFLKTAGRDVKLELKGLRSCGWFTSCGFDAKGSGSDKHGLLFFEFSPKSKKIVSIRFFWN